MTLEKPGKGVKIACPPPAARFGAVPAQGAVVRTPVLPAEEHARRGVRPGLLESRFASRRGGVSNPPEAVSAPVNRMLPEDDDMIRKIVAGACAATFALALCGCGGGGEEEGAGTRREPPKEKIAAPGAEIGAPQSEGEGDGG